MHSLNFNMYSFIYKFLGYCLVMSSYVLNKNTVFFYYFCLLVFAPNSSGKGNHIIYWLVWCGLQLTKA